MNVVSFFFPPILLLQPCWLDHLLLQRYHAPNPNVASCWRQSQTNACARSGLSASYRTATFLPSISSGRVKTWHQCRVLFFFTTRHKPWSELFKARRVCQKIEVRGSYHLLWGRCKGGLVSAQWCSGCIFKHCQLWCMLYLNGEWNLDWCLVLRCIL